MELPAESAELSPVWTAELLPALPAELLPVWMAELSPALPDSDCCNLYFRHHNL